MAAEAGEMLERTGVGFGFTLIVTVLEVPLVGSSAVRLSVPTTVRYEAGMVMNRLVLFEVFGMSVLPFT